MIASSNDRPLPSSPPASPASDLWLELLLADSALPTGGFVASGGLEAASQSRVHLDPRRDPTSLQRFILSSVHALAASHLPYASESHACARDHAGEPAKALGAIVKLDGSMDALVGGNHVARRASRAQGSAYVSLLEKGFLEERPEWAGLIGAFRREIRNGRTPGHLAIAFGLVCGCLGVSIDKMRYLLLFQHARALVSAAVRLNLLGPYAGQRTLLALRPNVEAILSSASIRSARLIAERDAPEGDEAWEAWFDIKNDVVRTATETVEEEAGAYARRARAAACQTSPVVDVVQGLHDRLYSRLFNS
ncbi:hypothetical protein HK101_010119 [Irineochytrium annulatum]|nr:hypothetical protein HK101_010119 [Irineochytrium annulatum]